MEGGGTPRLKLTALGWNLYHGLDRPPDGRLFTWRSRLLRTTEDNGTYIQVNRRLLRGFAETLAAADWDIAGLQEVPPEWAAPLARTCRADCYRTLTARNFGRPIRHAFAELNPDLIRSHAGGSNLMLVRSPWRIVAGSTQSIALNPPRRVIDPRIPIGLRERLRWLRECRRLQLARLRHGKAGAELWIANLHATNDLPVAAERELWAAVWRLVEIGGRLPLLVIGDFNLRPAESKLFAELQERFRFSAPTSAQAIDHVLARGLDADAAAAAWPAERRELTVRRRGGVRRLRLSDHDPVEASFRVRGTSPA